MGFVQFPSSSLARTSLALCPEDLERILAHAGIPPASSDPQYTQSSSTSWSRQGLMVPLLVSCTFYCTTLPPFHHTLVLHSPYQSTNAARVCLPRARTLVPPNSSPEDADMFRMPERVDVTYLLRCSRGNSSAQAVSFEARDVPQPAHPRALDMLIDTVTAR
jgi:hypothetical protein